LWPIAEGAAFVSPFIKSAFVPLPFPKEHKTSIIGHGGKIERKGMRNDGSTTN
jgi:hypothetical protein